MQAVLTKAKVRPFHLIKLKSLLYEPSQSQFKVHVKGQRTKVARSKSSFNDELSKEYNRLKRQNKALSTKHKEIQEKVINFLEQVNSRVSKQLNNI